MEQPLPAASGDTWPSFIIWQVGSEDVSRGRVLKVPVAFQLHLLKIPWRGHSFRMLVIDLLHFNYCCTRVEKVGDDPHRIHILPSLVIYFRQTLRIYYQTLCQLSYWFIPFFPVISHKFLKHNVTWQMWFCCAYFREREGIKARSMALFVCVLMSAAIKYLGRCGTDAKCLHVFTAGVNWWSRKWEKKWFGLMIFWGRQHSPECCWESHQ